MVNATKAMANAGKAAKAAKDMLIDARGHAAEAKMPMLTNTTWVTAVEKLGDFAVLAEPLLKHVTPANVSMGVSGMLVFSGVLHAIPGPTLKMQAKMLGMPAWFIMCAGLLMIASGALYHLKFVEGIYAVSLCMGGAFITAAKIPDPMHRPGGMMFSLLTLAATIWSHCQCAITVKPLNVDCDASVLTPQFSVICAVAFVAGVLGRIFVPTSGLAKLFGSEVAVKKEEKKAVSSAKVSDPVKKDSLKIEKMPDKTKDAEKTGARRRMDSPANRAKATGLF